MRSSFGSEGRTEKGKKNKIWPTQRDETCRIFTEPMRFVCALIDEKKKIK